MADTFNSEINVGPPPAALPKRRRSSLVGIIIVLLLLGAGGGYLWLNYNETLTDLIHAATGNTGSHEDAQGLASAPAEGGGVSAADFAAFQQQTGSSIQAATELLGAQQAELKRLSDQVQGLTTQLADLTSKIDHVQGRGAVPQAASASAAVASVPHPVRPTPTALRKRPPADKPAGAISVGGAPLPPQPAR